MLTLVALCTTIGRRLQTTAGMDPSQWTSQQCARIRGFALCGMPTDGSRFSRSTDPAESFIPGRKAQVLVRGAGARLADPVMVPPSSGFAMPGMRAASTVDVGR